MPPAPAETKSFDHDKLAAYMHKAKFNTVAGNFSFAQDGEWSQTRQVWTQFQNVQPNNLDQFRVAGPAEHWRIGSAGAVWHEEARLQVHADDGGPTMATSDLEAWQHRNEQKLA